MIDREFCALDRQGAVLVVYLKRPERLNALHSPAHFELSAVFDEVEADPALRCAVITGWGDKAFCAGNDLKFQAAGGSMERPATGFAGLTKRYDRRKPVIAAVNGVAFGGGFEITLAADICVAAENAAFALTEAKVGLAPLAGMHLLPRRVGLKVAMGTMLTGRMIGPERARTLGLVNDVTKPGESLARALEWARSIEECSPAAVATILDVVRSGLRFADERQALEHAYPSLEELRSHPDFAEGPRAFAEKRTPQWQKQSRD